MKRITVAFLEKQVERLNKLTGNPVEPYTRTEDGKLTVNYGNYHLDNAYNGWTLKQFLTPDSRGPLNVLRHSGSSNALSCGYITKKDLSNRIRAYMDGYCIAREQLKNYDDGYCIAKDL